MKLSAQAAEARPNESQSENVLFARREPRFEADNPAIIEVLDGTLRRFIVSVVDVSRPGLGILSPLELSVGSRLKIELVGGSIVYGEVRNSLVVPRGVQIGVSL